MTTSPGTDMPCSHRHIKNLVSREASLLPLEPEIRRALKELLHCVMSGGKLLVCGNGGSAADAEHIVGELMKGFMLPRTLGDGQLRKLAALFPALADEMRANLQQAIPAISLVGGVALPSAFINDVGADYMFAQQVLGLGRPGDILWGLSTSGNSVNVVRAFQVARAAGLRTLSFTGRNGGALAALSDTEIRVPQQETYRIQELHLQIYHALCADMEENLFGGESAACGASPGPRARRHARTRPGTRRFPRRGARACQKRWRRTRAAYSQVHSTGRS